MNDEEMVKVEFKIVKDSDRQTLMGILADAGYKVYTRVNYLVVAGHNVLYPTHWPDGKITVVELKTPKKKESEP